MAANNNTAEKRYAVVTGANKGIGLEICRQLASHGITVVLTARDEKRGLDALEKLKGLPFSENLLFHQLDVANSSSVASLAEFFRVQFGRLDILINNAGVVGSDLNPDGLRALAGGAQISWKDITAYHDYDLAVECLQINYYGAKKMIEAFVPLLKLSQSPRIVNVSSVAGKLENIPGERIRGILNDAVNLTEERVDELLNEFLKDFKEGSLEPNGWPPYYSAYIVSKAAMNAYTRIVAKKNPDFKVNCLCPGYVKTDINFNIGTLTVEEGAATPVKLALLPDDGPSGLFFIHGEVSSFE